MSITLNVASGIDFTNAADIVARAQSLALTAKESEVYPRLASLAFMLGNAAKTSQANAVPSFAAPFAAFAAVHYSDTSGRKLSASSASAYVSTLGAFVEAGYHAAWEGKAAADYVLDNGKGAFTTRGADLRRILKAYPNTAPTADQMAECLTPVKVKSPRDVARGVKETLAKTFGVGEGLTTVAAIAFADTMVNLSALIANLPETVANETDYAAIADAKRKAMKPVKK